MIQTRSTQLASNDAYHDLVVGDFGMTWLSIFKAIPGHWKWWQGWQIKLDTELVYEDNGDDDRYPDTAAGVVRKRRVIKWRKLPPTIRVEGRARRPCHVRKGLLGLEFGSVDMHVTAGTYVAFGLRRRPEDEKPADISDLLMPVMLTSSGVVRLTPSYSQG